MQSGFEGRGAVARTQALWDICVMLFYCHLYGIMRHGCCWGWRGDAVSCKTARCIQKETARSQSVSPLITALYPLWFRLSKQRCRGHQDCRVIEPAWAALSSTSAKNTSPTVTGHQVGENDCSHCPSTGHSHQPWPSLSKPATEKTFDTQVQHLNTCSFDANHAAHMTLIMSGYADSIFHGNTVFSQQNLTRQMLIHRKSKLYQRCPLLSAVVFHFVIELKAGTLNSRISCKIVNPDLWKRPIKIHWHMTKSAISLLIMQLIGWD